MRKAAILAAPSVSTASGRVEGLGMVLLEAAATGVPVVGSRSGGIPECVIEGRTGFLVPEGDAAALARRIGDLLDDGDMRQRMGGHARALVERRFDIRRQTEVLEDLYDRVLADRACGDRGRAAAP
jgi:glycosyltransferase involved in cell wall biosynthesis